MTTLRSSNEEEILAITINRKLAFRQNIKKNLRKAGQIMSPSPRYVDKNKRRINILQFQSNYCRLVWVFCQRRSTNLPITKLSYLSAMTLLYLYLVLMTEIYKIKNNVSSNNVLFI